MDVPIEAKGYPEVCGIVSRIAAKVILGIRDS